jgi:RHS repeat-associated protein
MHFLKKDLFQRLLTFLILEVFVLSNVLPSYTESIDKQDTSIVIDESKHPVSHENKKDVPSLFVTNSNETNRIEKSKVETALFDMKEMKDALIINSNKALVKGDIPVIMEYKQVKLQIPAGAVKQPVEIDIDELLEINQLNPGMDNVTGKSSGYRFLPHGMKFEKNILLSLPYDKSKVVTENDFLSLGSFYYNEETHKWEKLQLVSVDKTNGTVNSLTNHFTDIINGTLKLPEAKGPLSFDPTSIKDLNAASPLTGISQIQGLQSNSKGTANFNIPLNIPAGRNGMMPQISFNYDSDNSNGWLGVGFNISMPTISIDTKFGLPNYDGNDKYLFNGEELINAGKDKDDVVYKSRVETSFNRIIRKGTSPSNYIFEVTEKNGVRSVYGSDDAKLDGGKGIFIWYLKSVTDMNGNSITYNYSSNSANDKCIYLSKIDYTGHITENSGVYHVFFDNEVRDDVIINCRGKFRSEMNQRLSEIRVLFNTDLIRSYKITYRPNAESNFGKSEIQKISELDKNKTEFYKYDFSYYDMPAENNNYNGFMQAVKWENAGEMSKSKSSDSGAAFYGGIGLYHSAFTIGVSADTSSGDSLTKKEFIDIDGDGLPDLVSKDSMTGNVKYHKNIGTGFDKNERTISGLEDYFSRSDSDTNSFSVAGGIGPFGVNKGKKYSHTDADSILSDVNGDGYVDVVVKNADYFFLNMLFEGKSEFKKVKWGSSGVLNPGVQEDDNAELKNAFYLLDPIIKWKPYHSGTISIENNNIVKQNNDVEKVSDGIKLNLYKDNISLWSGMSSRNNQWKTKYNQTELDSSLFLKEGDVFSSSENQNIIKGIDVKKSDDNIYFRVNSIDDIADDAVVWNPTIYYEKIQFHDDLSDEYYDLPKTIDAGKKNAFLSGVNISDCYTSHYSQSNIDYYTLNLSLKEDAVNKLKKEMFDASFFLPAHISVDDLKTLLVKTTNEDYKKLFVTYYSLNPAKYRYDLKPGFSDSEENIMRTLIITSGIELKKYYYYSYNKTNHIVEKADGMLFINENYSKNIDKGVMTDSEFLSSNDIGDYSNSSIIVDKEENDGKTYVTKFYNKPFPSLVISDGQGYQLSFSSANSEFKWSADDDEIDITLDRGNGYNLKKYRIFKIKNPPQKIPSEIYVDMFASQIPSIIDKKNFNAAAAINFDLIQQTYIFDGKLNYNLVSGITYEQKVALLDVFAQVDGFSIYYRSAGDYFELEGGLTNDQLSIVKIQLSSLNQFSKMTKIITISEKRIYDVNKLNNAPVKSEVEVSFKNYENESNKTATGSIILEYIDNDGVTRKYIEYLHVFNLSNDFNMNNLNKTPDFIPQSQTSDSDLNSDKKDFNQDQISQYKADLEPFNGGVYGWFFGEWNGNMVEWNAAKINEQTNTNCKNTDDILDDNVAKDYSINFIAMNSRPAGTKIDTTNNSSDVDMTEFYSLIEQHPVYSQSIWHGTEYLSVDEVPSKQEGKDFDKVAYYFTSYVMGSTICPSRKGGDSIDKMPKKNGVIALDKMGDIRYGKEKGDVWSIGLGPLSTSQTKSDIRNEKDFMDINGDGYPDQVISNDGSVSSVVCNKQEDGSIGFTGGKDIGGSFSDIRHVISSVSGKGITGGSCGTSLSLKYGPKGNPTTLSLKLPSVGMTGSKSNGETWTKTDMFDINGDGLPDSIERSETGQFRVRLNCGDDFAPEESWATPGISSDDDVFKNFKDVRKNSVKCISESASCSIGQAYFAVGFSSTIDNLSENLTVIDISDINGDGLMDYLCSGTDKNDKDKNDIYVCINKGNGFLPPKIWYQYSDWDLSNTSMLSENNLNDLKKNGTTSLVFTSDKVDDKIINDIKSSISKSISGQFNPSESPVAISYDYSKSGWSSSCFSYDVNIGVNIYFTVFFITVVITLKPSLNGSESVSYGALRLTDINGDGAPDQVLRQGDQDYFRVKLNKSPGTGLMKQIVSPTGSITKLEYQKVGNTDDMPQSRFVLSRVTSYDGFEKDESGNLKTYITDFEYQNGKYDRDEREFYGFGIVKEINKGVIIPGNYDIENIKEYDTSNYYRKGLLCKETFEDSSGKTWSKKIYNFIQTQTISDSDFVKGVYYVPLTSIESMIYDEHGNLITTSQNYQYDRYGNITSFTDEGSSASGDEIFTQIKYDYDTIGKYLVQNPKYICVTDSTNKILRERKADYDIATGNLLKHYQTLNDSVNKIYDTVTTSYTYDKYGNMKTVTHPGGYTVTYDYEYNYTASSYRITTTDNSGYSSNVVMDYYTGAQISATDMSGSTMHDEYDSFGRIIKVWTDYDVYHPGSVKDDMSTANHAIEYVYYQSEFPLRAVTKNKIYHDSDRTECLNTVIIMDGFGRIIQSKKEGDVRQDDQSEPQYGMNVSGKIVYDKLGRPIQQGKPVFQPGGYNELYYDSGSIVKPTTIEYDTAGRIKRYIYPDDSTITTDYAFENNQLKIIITDPYGRKKISYKDIRDNTVKEEVFKRDLNDVSRYSNVDANADWQKITTTYDYSVMGELNQIIDTNNNITKFTYDSLGRCTSVDDKNNGIVINTYDIAGNLKYKQNSELIKLSQKIEYIYDSCNRLIKTIYPNMPSVTYTYAKSDSALYQRGRLTQIDDESGRTEFEYGKLGEKFNVSKTIKCDAFPSGRKFVTSYDYDYLGRMISIGYPDTYDMTSNPPIVRKGEKVIYEYDRGGLVNKVSGFFSDINQTEIYVSKIHYDERGRRKYIKFGNGVESSYVYDDERDQLKGVKTEIERPNGKVQYQNVAYTFDKVGNVINIANKTAGTFRLNTDQTYIYDDLYQIVQAAGVYEKPLVSYKNTYKQTFKYNDIGNMTNKSSQQMDTNGNADEKLNNSMEFVYSSDKPYQVKNIGNIVYDYDRNGNVLRKYLENNDGSQTGPQVDIVNGNNNSANIAYGYNWKKTNDGHILISEYQWDDENRLKKTVTNSDTVDYVYNASGEKVIRRVENESETLYVDNMYQIETQSLKMSITKHIFVGTTRIATKVTYEDMDNNSQTEKMNTFYFHQDHLGGTNVVTDYNGDYYQNFEYTPYGETWIEEGDYRNTGFITFKFAGKELDEKTGLYYFGSRYYDPQSSKWLSCDPERQHLNPYMYCRNNPLNYVDPNGNADKKAFCFGDESREQYDEGKKSVDKIKDQIKSVGTILNFEFPEKSPFWGKRKVVDIITGDVMKKMNEDRDGKNFKDTLKFYGAVIGVAALAAAVGFGIYKLLPKDAQSFIKNIDKKIDNIKAEPGDKSRFYGKWTFGTKEIIKGEWGDSDKEGLSGTLKVTSGFNLKYNFDNDKKSNLNLDIGYSGPKISGKFEDGSKNTYSGDISIDWSSMKDLKFKINISIDISEK